MLHGRKYEKKKHHLTIGIMKKCHNLARIPLHEFKYIKKFTIKNI